MPLLDTPLTAPLLADAAAAIGPVPESTTWAMMILGMGMSGLLLRLQRRRRWA